MNIMLYLKALFPTLEKNKILEDISISINELQNYSIPSYSTATEYFRMSKIKSDYTKDLSDIFYRNYDVKRGGKQVNFIAEISKRLPELLSNAIYVHDQLNSILEATSINEGLSIRKASLIRSAEAMSFMSKYMSELLNAVYVYEALAINAEIKENMELSPANIKYLNSNLLKFTRVFSDLAIDNKDFVKVYASIPDIMLNSRTEQAVKGIYNEKQIDPFSSGFISGFTYNPIYHIRMVVAEWQTNRYNANREKKKVLELRLLHLKILSEGKNDAALEKEINYLQGRIDNLERKMREVEQSLD